MDTKALNNTIKKIYRYFGSEWKSIYSDSAWQNVSAAVDGIRINIPEVDDVILGAGKYYNYLSSSLEAPYREYKLLIETQYGNISGYLRCCAAGSTDDPFSKYDMVISLWRDKGDASLNEDKQFNQKIEKQLQSITDWKEFYDFFDSYLYWEDDGHRIPVELNGKWNFLHNGKFLSEKWFDDIPQPFHYGYAVVMIGGRFNVIDKSGQYVFPTWQQSVRKCAEFFQNNVDKRKAELDRRIKVRGMVDEAFKKVMGID